MSHPPIESLVAHLDGELSGAAAIRVARHIARCGTCRTRLAELGESAAFVAATLGRIDAFEDDAASANDAVSVNDVGSGRTDAHGARTGGALLPRQRVWRWAAAFFVTTGAAAAAILGPGIGGGSDRAAASRAATPQAPPAMDSGGVVQVTPVDGVMDIALTGVAPGTGIEIAFGTARDVVIEVDGIASPHFRAERGRIALELDAMPVRLRIAYPVALRSGTIHVEGAAVVRIAAGSIDVLHHVEGISVMIRSTR